MEIISLDIRVFDSLVRRVETLAKKAEMLDRKDKDLSLSEWLDNEDVCRILGVTKRTLQNYRNSGILPYSQMRYKVLYRPEDVENLLNASHKNNNHEK